MTSNCTDAPSRKPEIHAIAESVGNCALVAMQLQNSREPDGAHCQEAVEAVCEGPSLHKGCFQILISSSILHSSACVRLGPLV